VKIGYSSWCNICTDEYYKLKYLKSIGSKTPKPIKAKEPSRPIGRPRKERLPNVFKSKIPDGFRKCAKCLVIHPKTKEFFQINRQNSSGFNSRCKTCWRDHWISKGGPERSRKIAKSQQGKEARKRSYQKNKAQNRAARAEYARMLRADPMYRIASNLRRANSGFIKSKGLMKSKTLNQYLGCSPVEFQNHLESLFQPGMTWDNYGFGMNKWNIDHRIPLASASDIEDLYKLSHYTNLQPMWQPENMIKSDKY